MSSATLAIALVGAATGIAGLAWQVYTWRQARKSRVAVQLWNTFVPTGIAEYPGLLVTVVNENDHEIRVEAVGLELQDGSGGDYTIEDPRLDEAALPGTVAAHDSGQIALLDEDATAAGFDLFEPLIAWADVAASGRFHSEPVTLRMRD